jgi:hypothetical protein
MIIEKKPKMYVEGFSIPVANIQINSSYFVTKHYTDWNNSSIWKLDYICVSFLK